MQWKQNTKIMEQKIRDKVYHLKFEQNEEDNADMMED